MMAVPLVLRHGMLYASLWFSLSKYNMANKMITSYAFDAGGNFNATGMIWSDDQIDGFGQISIGTKSHEH
jgi:hypothetical protein